MYMVSLSLIRVYKPISLYDTDHTYLTFEAAGSSQWPLKVEEMLQSILKNSSTKILGFPLIIHYF